VLHAMEKWCKTLVWSRLKISIILNSFLRLSSIAKKGEIERSKPLFGF